MLCVFAAGWSCLRPKKAAADIPKLPKVTLNGQENLDKVDKAKDTGNQLEFQRRLSGLKRNSYSADNIQNLPAGALAKWNSSETLSKFTKTPKLSSIKTLKTGSTAAKNNSHLDSKPKTKSYTVIQFAYRMVQFCGDKITRSTNLLPFSPTLTQFAFDWILLPAAGVMLLYHHHIVFFTDHILVNI